MSDSEFIEAVIAEYGPTIDLRLRPQDLVEIVRRATGAEDPEVGQATPLFGVLRPSSTHQSASPHRPLCTRHSRRLSPHPVGETPVPAPATPPEEGRKPAPAPVASPSEEPMDVPPMHDKGEVGLDDLMLELLKLQRRVSTIAKAVEKLRAAQRKPRKL